MKKKDTARPLARPYTPGLFSLKASARPQAPGLRHVAANTTRDPAGPVRLTPSQGGARAPLSPPSFPSFLPRPRPRRSSGPSRFSPPAAARYPPCCCCCCSSWISRNLLTTKERKICSILVAMTALARRPPPAPLLPAEKRGLRYPRMHRGSGRTRAPADVLAVGPHAIGCPHGETKRRRGRVAAGARRAALALSESHRAANLADFRWGGRGRCLVSQWSPPLPLPPAAARRHVGALTLPPGPANGSPLSTPPTSTALPSGRGPALPPSNGRNE